MSALLLLCLLTAGGTEEALRAFFPQSERVTYERLSAGQLTARLGYKPERASYVVYVAKSGERIDGYAVVDDELGQHEPITAAVRFDPLGRVTAVEVLAYREAYGREVRERRFRRQLEGLGPERPARLGGNVDAVSGATISSRSLVRLVNRAIVLVDVLRHR